MADFVSVLRRAVENLDDNTVQTRAALYERARAALVRQMQSLDPPLSDEELSRQIDELDQAIEDLEAGYAAAEAPAPSHEPPPPAEAAPPPPSPPVPAAPPEGAGPPTPVDGEDDPYARYYDEDTSSPAHRSFRSAVAETERLGAASSAAARSARSTLDGFGDERAPGEEPAAAAEPPYHEADMHEAAGTGHGEPPYESGGYDAPGQGDAPPGPPPPPEEGRSYHAYEEPGGEGVLRFAVWGIVALVLLGLVGVGVWQRDALGQIVASFTGDPAEPAEVKLDDRVPGPDGEEPGAPDDPPQVAEEPAPAPPADVAPAPPEPGETDMAVGEIEGETLDPDTRTAQALLVEEIDRASGATNSLGGSVDWSLVDDPEVPGGAEKVIRATIRVPDKNMSVAMAIRRNVDDSLPASHTIEILFDLPADFENGGVEQVPGMVMKATPQASGQPLVGAVVPVTSNFFLIGLSQTSIDRRRNIEELQRRAFMDIPIVYEDGSRALLSIAKGESGAEVFAEAFAAWGS